jgi:hypothetical protein
MHGKWTDENPKVGGLVVVEDDKDNVGDGGVDEREA